MDKTLTISQRRRYCPFLLLFLCFSIFEGAYAANTRPTITNMPATITVNEDRAIGDTVFTCSVTDPDDVNTDNGYQVFIIQFGNFERLYSLDAQTCDLKVAEPLDYETTKSYDIWLRAQDLGGLTHTRNVRINIVDVNDNAPVCSPYNVLGELDESATIGTIFASLSCSDVDTGLGGVVEFEAVSGDTNTIGIDVNTGKASIKRALDYDTEKDTYQIEVKVKDKGTPILSTKATILLSVRDVDDLNPVFSQPAGYNQAEVEDAPIGTTILTITATDGDAPNTAASRIIFGFESACNPDLLMIDQLNGAIIVKKNLDWETNPTITCQVYAYSSNRFSARVTVPVTVDVTDVNDGIPTFSKVFYQASIPENATVGDSVIQVQALDPDDGPDGDVSYSIEDSIFDIDPTSGLVTLKTAADYETATSHLVAVTATDAGTPALNSTVLLQVSILPVNEFTPVFLGVFSFTVQEDTVPGTSVWMVTTQDDDISLDGSVEYKVLTPGVPFVVDADSGIIRIAYDLDYEKTTAYEFVVEAKDNSSSIRRSFTQTFSVDITDVNDEPVTCDPMSTLVLKFPFPSIGATLANVSCYDLDSVATTLTYSIASGNDGSFQIDSSSGAISLATTPLTTKYKLTVDVTDGVASTSVTFTIFTETVLAFTNLPLTINKLEGDSGILTNITACCAFPRVLYTIVSGNNDNKLVLFETSGTLYQPVPYDREKKSSYTYEIKATSNSGQTASGFLTVIVDDANDITPTFAASVYQVKVDEGLAVSTVISQYSATDTDIGANAALTYSIVSGNTGGAFSIDGSGQLTLASGLDYETITSYTLVIEAVDGGTPALTGTTTVVVDIQNNDEFPPSLMPLPGSFTGVFSEDIALGTSVFIVQANDADANMNFTYAITAGNDDGDFTIDPISGYISIVKFLDRERKEFYLLTLVATDQNGDTVTDNLPVTVTDINDNNPEFTPNVFKFDIAHNTGVGVSVGDIVISDKDKGVNANVVVTILSGNVGGAFTLSGLQIQTAVTMDYEKVKRYKLVVQGVDGGTPARSASAVVIVNVLPDLTQPKYFTASDTISVSENQKAGYQIYDLNATALGAVENDGSMTYTITSGNTNNDFKVRGGSGQIIVQNTLDYETTASYTLVITASNTVTPANADTFTLTVNVINLNDNSPIFAQGSYSFYVDEDAAINTPVGLVLASDADLGAFGTVTESMTGSTDFSINANTGVISVATGLNYITKNNYNLLVTAKDGGSPALTARVSVVIRVKDKNNNSPIFTSGNTFSVPDSVEIGSEVFHVHATDLDTGALGSVLYSITADSSGGKFSLDSTTGILTTTSLLNALVDSSYTLTVTATDGGTPSLQSTSTITITVISTNPNFNSPVFSGPDPVAVVVNRQATPGTVVLANSATDADVGISGELVHKIASGNDDGFFIINGTTGAITTATYLLTADNSYSLIIVAKDKGTPQRSASLTVDITVSPIVTTSITADYTFTLAEDAPVLSVVGQIPVDPGRTVSAYNIQSGNYGLSFSIGVGSGDAGVLTVNKPLDYEVIPLYSLVVAATTDIGILTKVVAVRVTDVNDNPPVFASSTLTLTVHENTPVGYTLATISYTDADTDPANKNDTLSMSAPGSTLFSYNQSGHLVLTSSPDYEVMSSLIFDLVAAENNSPFTSSTITVTVYIIDVAEVEPGYISSINNKGLISLEIPYQASGGHVVHTLTPGDFGIVATPSATVEFVSYESSIPFSVDSSTGEVKVKANAQLKDKSKYFHWVLCKTTDGGDTTSRVSVLRIDTFDRDSQMIVVEFAESYSDVKANLAKFRARAQAFFPSTRRVGIYNIVDTSTAARRRLLATQTAAYVYVVGDTSTDDLENVNQDKTFLSDDDILAVLQASSDGSPVSSLSDPSGLEVITVEPFQEKQGSDYDFASSPAGIAVFCLLALLLIVGIAMLVVCLYYRQQTKEGQWTSDDEANENERENETGIHTVQNKTLKGHPNNNRKGNNDFFEYISAPDPNSKSTSTDDLL